MAAHRTPIRRTALVATTGAAALVLAACSGSSDGHDTGAMGPDSSVSATATVEGGAHNAADVSFSKEMIQHHRQAIEMAELADSRASSKRVKDLAAKIKGAQEPEIRTMSGWLTAWSEEVPADMSGTSHDMSGSMPGMTSSNDMAELKIASGTAFDRMFLDMMVKHHEGAVDLATTEKSNGAYGPATKLADDVITAQTAEIELMNRVLDKS